MAAKYTTKIDADVMDVLERSTITLNAVTLPAGQLDRKLYERVDKVLKAAGGKWNRSAKAHLFPSDPRTILGLAMETGGIVDGKKKLQQFFTPGALAAEIVESANIRPGMKVLEPSAGAGALAREASFYTAEDSDIRCYEIDPVLCEKLADNGFTVVPGDFLEQKPDPIFDRVVMNPPFAGDQDVRHVTHALKFLKKGGVLKAIMGAGMKSNEWKETREFRDLVQELGGTIEDLPEGSFTESGTGVRTVLVTIQLPEWFTFGPYTGRE